MISRRDLLQWAGVGGVGLLAGAARNASAQPMSHDMSSMEGMSGMGMASAPATASPAMAKAKRHAQGYLPVRTLNGWTLPYKMNGGVKEFHLVAEEIEHEFAPGSRAKCWGYNGTTPGPTLELV